MWAPVNAPASLPSRAIVTFSQAVDSLLACRHASTPQRHSSVAPGVPLGQVTEFAGGAGSGKTTLALQLALDVQIPASFGGVAGGALIIDTEGGVFAERLAEMAGALENHLLRIADRRGVGGGGSGVGVTAATLLSNVRISRTTSWAALLSVLADLPRALVHEENARALERMDDGVEGGALQLLPVRIVIIDSIALPVRCALATSDVGERLRALASLGAALHALAATGIAVVVTNHVTSRMLGAVGASDAAGGGVCGGDALAAALDGDAASRLVPALGDSWGLVPCSRLVLGWRAGVRVAVLEKSLLGSGGGSVTSVTGGVGESGLPRLPPAEFVINSMGVRGLKATKRAPAVA